PDVNWPKFLLHSLCGVLDCLRVSHIERQNQRAPACFFYFSLGFFEPLLISSDQTDRGSMLPELASRSAPHTCGRSRNHNNFIFLHVVWKDERRRRLFLVREDVS